MDIKEAVDMRMNRPKPLLFSITADMKVAELLTIVKNLDDLMFVVPYILVIYMFNLGPTICTLYSLSLSSLALHISGAICTHHQEHNFRVQP
jgi:hypothetical protein